MVVIIGAGLAGLTCAKSLHNAGADFLLLEASETPGGRVQSTSRDGFTLDQGFQVILDSYPSVRQYTDLPGLKPRYFDAGALLWDQGTFYETKSPLKHPSSVFSDLSSPAFSFTDKVRFTTLVSTLLPSADYELLRKCAEKSDETTIDYLKRLGCGEELISRFIQPFFGGVFLDNALETSKGLFWFYLKKFATGRAFLPAAGAGAFPRQLCDGLPARRVRFGARVRSLETQGNQVTGLTLENGERLPADQVVLATEEPAALALLGEEKPARPHSSVSVLYFQSDVPLYTQKLLVLPAGASRLVRHFVQITNVVPEYAPHGKHLLSATILDTRGLSDDDLSLAARQEIAEVFPGASAKLETLAVQHIPYATLRQPPGFAAGLTPATRFANLRRAGDQVASSSIEAAMHSGQQAALDCLATQK